MRRDRGPPLQRSRSGKSARDTDRTDAGSALDRGRAAYARRAWREAAEALAGVDRDESLRVEDLESFLAEPTPDTHDELWDQCAYDLDTLRIRMGADWDAFKEYNLDRANSQEVMGALGYLLERFGVRAIPPERLEHIDAPTTLIWGGTTSPRRWPWPRPRPSGTAGRCG